MVSKFRVPRRRLSKIGVGKRSRQSRCWLLLLLCCCLLLLSLIKRAKSVVVMPEDDDDLGERERLLLLNDDVNDDVNDDDFFYASLPSSTSSSSSSRDVIKSLLMMSSKTTLTTLTKQRATTNNNNNKSFFVARATTTTMISFLFFLCLLRGGGDGVGPLSSGRRRPPSEEERVNKVVGDAMVVLKAAGGGTPLPRERAARVATFVQKNTRGSFEEAKGKNTKERVKRMEEAAKKRLVAPRGGGGGVDRKTDDDAETKTTASVEEDENVQNEEGEEKPNSTSRVGANARTVLTSAFDVFKNAEHEDAGKETKKYFKNNAKCENVFTLGLEGVGHHAFQMGKDAFVKTLLRDHLNNVRAKDRAGNNNDIDDDNDDDKYKDIVEKHAREEDRMFIDNDDHFWNLILENKYDEIFKTFRKGCEKEAKKNGNEKTACYSTRSFSFPHKLGPFATDSGLDVNHALRWDPSNPEHRKYLFDHGHPINILKYFEAAERNGCRVKFILLHRNIVETTRSHKTWDRGLENHLNVLKMFAEYIDVSLANLPSNSWRRVNYEDFWRPQEERDKIFQALATDYLHWSSDAHDSFVNSQFDLNVHPRKYKTADRPPCEEVRELDRTQRNFFDQKLTSYSRRDKHVTNLPLSHFFTESPNKDMYKECWEASKASLSGIV